MIEWAERAEDELPAESLSVYLSHVSENGRELGFLAEGARYEGLMQELKTRIKGIYTEVGP